MNMHEMTAPAPRPNRLLDALALAALLGLAWCACRASHQHRRTSRSVSAPAAVHTWEAEGGRPLPEHEGG